MEVEKERKKGVDRGSEREREGEKEREREMDINRATCQG